MTELHQIHPEEERPSQTALLPTSISANAAAVAAAGNISSSSNNIINSSSHESVLAPSAAAQNKSLIGKYLARPWKRFRRIFGSKQPKTYDYLPYKFLERPAAALTLRKLHSSSPSSIILFSVYHIILLVSAILFAKFSSYSASIAGFPSGRVQTISCSSSFLDGSSCGLNQVNCEPFSQTIAVRCPASCDQQKAWTPVFLGTTAVQYQQFVVGGANGLYRGDSWICPAAIHANLFSASSGGCVIAKLTPSQNETYNTTQHSVRNGINSLSFNSTYPASLQFSSVSSSSSSSSSYCTDLGWPSLGFFIPLLLIIPFLSPSRKHCYWAVLIWIYLYWVFISPDTGKTDTNIQQALATLIPYLATLYFLYTFIFSYTLPKPGKFPFEVSLMWIAFLWLGFAVDLLSSYLPPLPTLSFNANMFRNPGSVATILVILILVAILVIAFIYLHWRQDTLFPLLVGYIAFFVVYGVLPSIVGLSIHLHHYIWSLLLMPLSRIRVRGTLVCQGILLGIFAQGVIKYGFASPFDTHMQANTIYTQGTTRTIWNISQSELQKNYTVRWVYPFNSTLNLTDVDTASLQSALKMNAADATNEVGFNQYSLMLNDVEVYRGKQAQFTLSNVSLAVFPAMNAISASYFLRVAPVAYGSIQDYGPIAMISPSNGSVYQFPAFSN